MGTVRESRANIAFGRFVVSPLRLQLLADGQPVSLGGRAFDILLALIEAGGAVVSKEALMARVWPDRVVEENALQAQISALRAALGPERGLIRTVSGRGYQFAGEIRLLQEGKDEPADIGEAAAAPRLGLPPTNLPGSVSELIGRQDELGEVLSLAAAHRLVTLVGPGGIGKTRLALAVARALLPEFANGVWLAELAPLSDPGLVPATVAAAAGLELAAGEISARRVAQALTGRRLLLVLDTCEHVIDAAAEMAEAVLRMCPGAQIIATSRESLRAEGEQTYPVAPLAVPAEGNDPWQYGAVRLFAARSRGTGAQVSDDGRVAAAVAAICRQLDGIPLAIELAAARASTLGVVELAAHLDDRFNLLTGGRRTALRRHQTLRATLDWSYELLAEPERVILRRLAIFAGAFSLQAASDVAASAGIAPLDVVNGLANLVAKSLVTAEPGGHLARYRLLDTMRAYALEKLVASGEVNSIRRRHAEYYRDLLQSAAVDQAAIDDWPAAYTGEIGNIRAVLAWAFAPGGDPSIGVALAAASVPIWFEMSLLTECRGWMEKALGVLDAADRGTSREMIVQCALGYSLMFAQGMNDRARTALTRANELAEGLADLDYQLRTLAGLASICHRLQDYHGAVALGRRAEEAVKASSDPIALATADWILGSSLQLLGEYAEALTYAQRTYVRTAIPAVRRAHIAHLGRDSCISAGSTTAIVLWARGLPDQSSQTARNVLADAEARDHPVSLCLALTWCGCIVPLRLGDLQTAERSIARLKEHAQRHGLSAYFANGLCFEGQLAAMRGDVVAAESLLRAGLKNLRQTQSETLYTVFLTGLAEVLMISTHRNESLAAAKEALLRTEQSNAFWWMPESLRIRGEVLLSCKDDTNAADEQFRRSLDLAHRQGALSWELRTATSLARLRRGQGRVVEACELLAPVYGRFTEGFGSADLRSAKQLLDELA
jgi:predicted ATPase/DNA-binding winged helix-turn-helix (wHTH) protein